MQRKRRLTWAWSVLYGLTVFTSTFHNAALADEPSQKWAFLIGVDDYIEANDLNYCGADQEALSASLVASGFPTEQVFVLHDEAEDHKYLPLKRNIEKQLDIILGLVQDNDVLVLAFSGHGVQFGENSYLCPTDADLDDPSSLISLDVVYRRLKDCRASMKVLLVDACRNAPRLGGQKSPVKETQQFDSTLHHQSAPEGVVLLNSCAPGEISWEAPNLEHGVFMHYVLKGLEGEADTNSNGQVSLGELSDFASRKTGIYVARVFNESQRPFMRAEGDIRVLNFKLANSAASDGRSLPKPAAPSKQSARQITNSIGMKLNLIPAGEYLMGGSRPRGELQKLFDSPYSPPASEQPQHPVNISQPYYLGTTEVTQGQWLEVMPTRPWAGQKWVKEGKDIAASYISWGDAYEFCRKLSAKEDATYRLPTEAEWEYACRAGSNSLFSFGDEISSLDNFAWHSGNTAGYCVRTGLRHDECRLHGASKRPNPWGLYNMHGNASEWCSDWYSQSTYKNSRHSDPGGPEFGTNRVTRGGSWKRDPLLCRSASRSGSPPTHRSELVGFRVVRNIATTR